MCKGGCLAFESNKACGLGLTGTSDNGVTTVYGSLSVTVYFCAVVSVCC